MDAGMKAAVDEIGGKMDAMDAGSPPDAGNAAPADKSDKPAEGEDGSSKIDPMKVDAAYDKLKADDPEAAKGLAACEQVMGGPDMVKAMLRSFVDGLDSDEDKMDGLKGFSLDVMAGPAPKKPNDLFGPLGRAMQSGSKKKA